MSHLQVFWRVGFVALIVDPIAPNFAALRRVSSDVERA
jgi:hypothetical protein